MSPFLTDRRLRRFRKTWQRSSRPSQQKVVFSPPSKVVVRCASSTWRGHAEEVGAEVGDAEEEEELPREVGESNRRAEGSRGSASIQVEASVSGGFLLTSVLPRLVLTCCVEQHEQVMQEISPFEDQRRQVMKMFSDVPSVDLSSVISLPNIFVSSHPDIGILYFGVVALLDMSMAKEGEDA